MERIMLKSKIHRAVVTGTDMNYEGSISIDRELLTFADILPYEKVHVWNVTNGKRFVTYAIEGRSGEISVNGSAAHRCYTGDVVIIASFAMYDEKDSKNIVPKIVFVDESNRLK
ncbi:MAG: aspartate 1-decarboxylase [archaeon]